MDNNQDQTEYPLLYPITILIIVIFIANYVFITFLPESNFWMNMTTEGFSLIVAYVLIDRFLRRESKNKEFEELLLQLSNPDKSIAKLAFARLTQIHELTDFEKIQDLSFINLEDTTLVGISFANCSLYCANLKNAILIGCDLRGSNLTDANLEGAIAFDLNRPDYTNLDIEVIRTNILRQYPTYDDMQESEIEDTVIALKEGRNWTALFNPETILPSGIKWKDLNSLRQFTGIWDHHWTSASPGRLWRSKNILSPAHSANRIQSDFKPVGESLRIYLIFESTHAIPSRELWNQVLHVTTVSDLFSNIYPPDTLIPLGPNHLFHFRISVNPYGIAILGEINVEAVYERSLLRLFYKQIESEFYRNNLTLRFSNPILSRQDIRINYDDKVFISQLEQIIENRVKTHAKDITNLRLDKFDNSDYETFANDFKAQVIAFNSPRQASKEAQQYLRNNHELWESDGAEIK